MPFKTGLSQYDQVFLFSVIQFGIPTKEPTTVAPTLSPSGMTFFINIFRMKLIEIVYLVATATFGH